MPLHDAHVPGGKVPVKELSCKVSMRRLVTLVRVVGMGPVREFL